MDKPVLLIDGNNLAHFLYTNLVSGQKMTHEDGQRLIGHLSDYARTYGEWLAVELCLDRSPGIPAALPDGLRVFAAEYPQTGDDLLLGRLAYHCYNQHPCLVITNDEDMLEEAARTGAPTLKVSDFVRRAGLVNPVFRDPADLPPIPVPKIRATDLPQTLSNSVYMRIVQDDRAPRIKPAEPVPAPKTQSCPRPASAAEREVAAAKLALLKEKFSTAKPATTKTEPIPPIPSSPVVQPVASKTSPAAPQTTGEAGPYYLLNLESWPVPEGARFLLNAFCPAHQAEYQALMQAFDHQSLRPDDLRALADLLLHACGAEADFARRGALMNRVRLALLQAEGGPLSLAELAERTGFKLSGLRGRIKEKAGNWVAIVDG